MASSSNGGLTSSDYGPGSGGAGGKFRKRPFRRMIQATPYDRPPSAFRSPTRNVVSWLSKMVVDPASKIVSAGAHYFFSSVLRKRLPPPSLPVMNQESVGGHMMSVPSNCAGEVFGANGSGKCINYSDVNGISELEQILKKKTFTRSEISCLIELLNSRTVDLPVGNVDERTEVDLPQQEPNFERHKGLASCSRKEHCFERDGSKKTLFNPVVGSRDLDEDSASPAERAIAYMGTRSTVSPSTLGLPGQAPREDATLPKNVPSSSNLPVMSLSPMFARARVADKSPSVLRSRGRSAIYSMARTPYSRVRLTTSGKGADLTTYSGSGSQVFSSSKQAQGQQVLKRRSCVMDDIGSMSSMRRDRQKFVLAQGNHLFNHRKPVGSDFCEGIEHKTPNSVFVNDHMPISVTLGKGEDSDIPITSYSPSNSKSSTPTTRYTPGASQPCGTAAKILQHLEVLAPKDKIFDSKLVSDERKSPSKLTQSMLHGKALRSLEDANSSKLLQNAQDSYNLKDSLQSGLRNACYSPSKKQAKFEENGLIKLEYSLDALDHVGKNDSTVSDNGSLPGSSTDQAVITNLFAQSPQKKLAFQISAPEDSFDLDDDIDTNVPASCDIHSNRSASVSRTEGRGKLDGYVMEGQLSFADATTVVHDLLCADTKTDVDSVPGTSDGGADESAGITVLTSGSFGTTQPVVLAQVNSAHDSCSSAIHVEVPFLAFSSASAVAESSGLKYGVMPDLMTSDLNSLVSIPSKVTGAEAEIATPDAPGINTTWENGHSVGLFKDPEPAASASTTVNTTSSFDVHCSKSDSHAAPETSSSNWTFKTFASTTSSTHATTSVPVASSNSLFATAVTTSDVPIFNIGSSVSSTAVLTESATLSEEKADENKRIDKADIFGSSASLSFENTSLSTNISRSSIFGFDSSGTRSSVNSHSGGFIFGSTGGSVVDSQASLSEPSASNSSKTPPLQFGSSATSPFFGTSGMASFSWSPITSSISPTGLFSSASGTTLERNSLASSSEKNPVGTSSAAATGIFTFGSRSSASSSGADSISASSDISPSLFIFGSASTSSGTNSICPSTSATPSIFPFGVNSASSSGTNSISSTSGSTSSVFGSSCQTSTLGSPFSFPSSTGFTFGALPTSTTSNSTSSMVFSASTSASTGSMFTFLAASSATFGPPPSQSHPIFGNSVPIFAASSTNGDQMSMEDSMAEDSVQASAPAGPVFSQSPHAAFMSGPAAAVPAASFQFGGGPHNQAAANMFPFQASSSLEFSAGGSFSLGSGGGDKSTRKILKANRNKYRRKEKYFC